MSIPRLFILFLVLLSSLQANAPTLAVLDFTAEGITVQESRFLTNRLRTQLTQIGGFKVLVRGEMEAIFETRNYNDLDCITDECAVRAGSLLGVEMIIAGAFGKLGSTYTIDIRLVDVATSELLKMVSYNHHGFVDGIISEVLKGAAKDLTNYDVVDEVVDDSPFNGNIKDDTFVDLKMTALDGNIPEISDYEVVTFSTEKDVANFIEGKIPGGDPKKTKQICSEFWNAQEVLSVLRHADAGIIVLKHTGDLREGICLAISEQGYPVVPAYAILKTVEPFPLTKTELAKWTEHVATEISISGSSRTLMMLGSGKFGEIHFRLNPDNPTVLEYDVQITDEVADKENFSVVISGINRWKLTTYGDQTLKWLF